MSELISRPELEVPTFRDRVKGIFKANLIKSEVLVEPVEHKQSAEDLKEKARRRLELFKQNPEAAAERFGRRIAQEFDNFSNDLTDSFNAYFVISSELHYESDAAQMHRLSHKYFADSFGLTAEEVLARDTGNGQKHTIIAKNGAELQVQFNRYEEGAPPSGIMYRGVKH